MKKANSSWRFPVAVGLVNLMLAWPLSHAAAEQRQPYVPRAPYSSPYSSQEQEDASSAAQWIGAAFMVGLLYCAWTDCVGGGNSAGNPPRQRRQEDGGQQPEYARPDTSAGCTWGDRALNNCK